MDAAGRLARAIAHAATMPGQPRLVSKSVRSALNSRSGQRGILQSAALQIALGDRPRAARSRRGCGRPRGCGRAGG